MTCTFHKTPVPSFIVSYLFFNMFLQIDIFQTSRISSVSKSESLKVEKLCIEIRRTSVSFSPVILRHNCLVERGYSSPLSTDPDSPQLCRNSAPAPKWGSVRPENRKTKRFGQSSYFLHLLKIYPIFI